MINLNWLYRQLWVIAPIFIKHYLRKRAKKSPAYLQHWSERFGQPIPNPIKHPLWIHAVSVGETRAAQPIINELKKYFPDDPILITQMTPTGRATAESLYPDAQCRYLPYDKPEYIHQFIKEHQPKLGILMETEIWPNLIHACSQANIPLFLANARLSEKSLNSYLKVRSLIKPAMETLRGCYAQTAEDAERLHLIGASYIHVCGNSKYDIRPPENMHQLATQFKQWIGNRPVVVCASTREYHGIDEAEILLKAWQAYQGDALLVLIPRHPERFQSTFNLACQYHFKTQKRSDNQSIDSTTQVWIGDSMGELFAYYLAADIAFVGGSLVDTGCQNIIEPIACNVPTLFGFSTFNFKDACENAQKVGAAKQVYTAEDWQKNISEWLNQPELRSQYAQNAYQFIQQHQGASACMAHQIAQHIKHIDKDN